MLGGGVVKRKPSMLGIVVMITFLPSRRTGFNSQQGCSQIFACGNHAGQCRWSAGFLGNLLFPSPFHSGAAPYLTSLHHHRNIFVIAFVSLSKTRGVGTFWIGPVGLFKLMGLRINSLEFGALYSPKSLCTWSCFGHSRHRSEEVMRVTLIHVALTPAHLHARF
ncbi:hypothetical protein PR048_012934 [Dryococelus australis]|uniref:Secreted protein n=1 Tax=Dryococelus australis TaxID=614101 RepID=A0ABQ9HQT5_9NEOP|nr:hypothetical protein PR048_012934 [Dryococelus australis]